MTTPIQETWQEEFDKEFRCNCEQSPKPHYAFDMNGKSVKSFISTLLQRKERETIKKCLEVIDTRIDYEKKYRVGSYQNGFSGSESGECCDKCRMEDKHFNGHADALKAVVGCRNPFQIESTCQCHIPFRKVAVATKLKTLEELRDNITKLTTNPL